MSSESSLRLLMDDGAIVARFVPALTPEQYAELLAISQEVKTKEQVCRAIVIAAANPLGPEPMTMAS